MAATTTTTTTATSPNGSKSSTISNLKKQLITHEDPGHIHKILGILCLCSFVWRFTMIGRSDMGFQTHPSLTLPTFILHWSLTVSSFIFKIPSKRISTGDRIWPEYRLHALVFLSRSLVLLTGYYYEEYYNLPPNYNFNWIVVLLTLIAADVSSWSVDDASGTIRGLSIHPFVTYLFSMIQFGATGGFLYGVRRYSLYFYVVVVVQLNPFIMTLRRKNLVSKSFLVTFYGLMLLYAYYFGVVEIQLYTPYGINSFLCFTTIGNCATLLRLGPRLPIIRYVQDYKVLLWIILGYTLRFVRPHFDTKESLSLNVLGTVIFIQVAVLVLGIWKGFIRDRNNSNNKDHKQ